MNIFLILISAVAAILALLRIYAIWIEHQDKEVRKQS